MSRIEELPFLLQDQQPARETFRADVLAGLARRQKTLPCKYLYDERGSRLFDRICELEEYYPTRTELSITRRHARHIARLIGPAARLIEFGSGSSIKTRILLDALIDPAGYVPIDISRDHLLRSAAGLADDYPQLRVTPLCADYTRDFELPPEETGTARPVAYFPGSTIGNFERQEALSFLRRVRTICGTESGLLIGVDLVKDPRRLHAAYNDALGVTADFNLNMLVRINRELGGNFTLDAFTHYACFNPGLGRVEMHLVSNERQAAQIAGRSIFFEQGEGVQTENCYKYTPDGFAGLASEAGWEVRQVWMDEMRLFSVQFLLAG